MVLPPTWRRFEGFEETYLELGDEDKDLSPYLEHSLQRLLFVHPTKCIRLLRPGQYASLGIYM